MATNSDEQKILMLMAYLAGQDQSLDTIKKFFDSNTPARQITTTVNGLVRKGLLKEEHNYYYGRKSFRLADGIFFEYLTMLLKPDNRLWFNRIARTTRKLRNITVLTDVAYAIRLIQNCHTSTYSSYHASFSLLVKEVACIFTNPDYRNIVLGLCDEILIPVLDKFFGEAIVADTDLPWDYIRQLFIDHCSQTTVDLNRPGLITRFNYYYYLGTGELVGDINSFKVDESSLLIVAIKKLYEKDYAESFKLFTKAMTAHNKLASYGYKGSFSSFAANYYYVLCMMLNGSDAASKKLSALYNKDSFTIYYKFNVVFKLIKTFFFDHKEIDFESASVNQIAQDPTAKAPYLLAWMVAKLTWTLPKGGVELDFTMAPHWAWLRAELRPTGLVGNAEGLKFPDSVFGRLKIKPLWETKLEEIINAGNDKAKDDADRQERLLYIIDNTYVQALLQKKKKDGTWSPGRRMNTTALKKLKVDSPQILDENDKKIIDKQSYYDYYISLPHNIDKLVGCDHIFTGDVTDLHQVNIHEDKPFLIIDKEKDGSFSVTTNVEELASATTRAAYYRKNTDTDYSVFTPTTFEKRVYAQILSQRKYPKEAEPLIMKLIATLGGKTEVHSNMVVELDNLERVDGQTKLTLRCVPIDAITFAISVSVHVFEDMSFAPGEGNVNAIATSNGKKVQVVRHLRVEKRNMHLFTQELVNVGVIDDENDFAPTMTTETLSVGTGAFLEIMEWVKNNSNICEMEWPEGERLKYHPAVGAKSVNINFKSKNGWFDVEGDIHIDEDEIISLQQLLEMMHEQGYRKYIKVGDNEYISLSSELKRILKRLDTVTTDRRNHLQMSTAAAGLIGDVIDNNNLHIGKNKELEALRKRIKDSTTSEPQVPNSLNATLRDYQLEGYEWMWRVTSWGAGACLADDMGLGKTLQTITLLLDQAENGAALVVAPASVVPNWRNELARFAPTLNVTILNSADDREKAIDEAGAGDVIVSTYALLNIQHKKLSEKEWDVVCLDEAHTIKNPNTKMSKAAMMLQAKRKVILTGTPIQNHLSELWNLFQFINPGLLGSAEQFGKKFIEPIENKHDKERQRQLRRLISPFLLRRTKNDVLDELPEKNEITMPVELSDEEMKVYEVHRRMAEKSVRADKTVKVSTLAEITKLREMACSVSLVDKKWKHESSKVAAFVNLAENLNDSGNRALVFSQFTSFFDQVRKAMDKAKLPYLYLDGSTPMGQREALVKKFQHGECPFFLISLKAGGLGLNLTGANYVIHLDPWWNPAIEQQATDRAYRIGQKQDVTVYHLISQHTIEEKILRLHKSKRDLADSLLEGTDMGHALTQEELLELLA